ncbi:hypothetical protein LOC67_20100 [Stieleria sp. JC731]|uniref:hypothetical protein n=1 Tax=Pirellulaceae TaxID=2691357 RepID=UPI001E4C4D8B|nr:hypothetical protein [Stieleria sp. JC731]MCC9602859.1 hypothetical protein [Stieleria sp. JC731]
MAWSWSHSHEAYAAVEEQLQLKAEAANNGNQEAADWLQVIWAEWIASDWREDRVTTDLDLKKHETGLIRAKRQGEQLGYDKLAADIWNWSSELATCTSGGWDAWVCPFGCHLLPFAVEVD